jgi:hypothetical protein
MAEARAPHRMPDAISVRAIAGGAFAVAIAISLSMLGAYALIRVGERPISVPIAAATPGGPPAIEGSVSLQTAPAVDIAVYRAEKLRLLREYAWVDPKRGIVRVPIDVAMDLLMRERNGEAKR